MIDKDKWVPELTAKLREAFHERLLFVGLQGSYRRGEATESSDIDIVVILDRLEIGDLETYRGLIGEMPQSEKACGFVGGRAELLAWPKYEIFQMGQETQPCYGRLEELLPEITRADIEESVRIGAANLYHMACHTFLYDAEETRPEVLRGAYKGLFFILQLLHYLRSGHYPHSKKELLPQLQGDEREMLELAMNWDERKAQREADSRMLFERLIRWSAAVLQNRE